MKNVSAAAIICCISLVLVGCSTTYKRTAMIDQMILSMSEEDAVQVLRENFTPAYVEKDIDGEKRIGLNGMCTRYSNEVDHKFKIDAAGIVYNGVEQVYDSASVSPISPTSFRVQTYYKDAEIIIGIQFEDIAWVRVFEPGVLNAICFPPAGESEVRIQMSTSLRDWHVAIIKTKNKEAVISALLRLRPDLDVRM